MKTALHHNQFKTTIACGATSYSIFTRNRFYQVKFLSFQPWQYNVLKIHLQVSTSIFLTKRVLIKIADDLHLFKTSILIRSCWSAPLLFLELGALFVLYTYWFVWRIMRTLVNGAWSPYNKIIKWQLIWLFRTLIYEFCSSLQTSLDCKPCHNTAESWII